MRRKTVRPYGQSGSGMRLISLLMALAVLGMLYERLKDPATWRALADDQEPPPRQTERKPDESPEIVVPGPNDLDDEEFAKAQELFEMLVDNAPLKSREYGPIWKLLEWTRTQPMAELEKRARDDVPFAQLFEQPNKYRGQLINLRLHLLRVNSYTYDPAENPMGVDKVYEAWGGTDESRSFPYVVDFLDLPPGLPKGAFIHAEVAFTGYFLKIMSYKAFDEKRGDRTLRAPLLLGRMRLISTPKPPPEMKLDLMPILLIGIGGLAIIGGTIYVGTRGRKKSTIKMLPKTLSTISTVDEPDFDSLIGQIVTTTPQESTSALAVTAPNAQGSTARLATETNVAIANDPMTNS